MCLDVGGAARLEVDRVEEITELGLTAKQREPLLRRDVAAVELLGDVRQLPDDLCTVENAAHVTRLAGRPNAIAPAAAIGEFAHANL